MRQWNLLPWLTSKTVKARIFTLTPNMLAKKNPASGPGFYRIVRAFNDRAGHPTGRHDRALCIQRPDPSIPVCEAHCQRRRSTAELL